MSRAIKEEILAFVVARKTRNPGLSVRKLSKLVKDRFSEDISKSTISWVLKKNSLSSPRGRGVTKVLDGSVRSELAGFGIFLAAERMLGVIEAIAQSQKVLSGAKVFQMETLEASAMAWLLSSMLYDIGFERAQGYEKNEIWGLMGRRVSRPTLKRYLQLLNSTELIKKHIVMDIKNRISWLSSIRIETDSGDGFLIDAQQRSLWGEKIPQLNYIATNWFTNSYVKSCLTQKDPLSILSGGPETDSHESLKGS
jgi:hypothetical protein